MAAFKEQLESVLKRAEILQEDLTQLLMESSRNSVASEFSKAVFRQQEVALLLGEANRKTWTAFHKGE